MCAGGRLPGIAEDIFPRLDSRGRQGEKMTPVPTPTTEEAKFFVELGGKIAGVFIAFVAGIVSATWAIASRVKGYEKRLESIEEIQKTCPGKSLANIDEKLDRLHERIDDILLKGAGK